MSLQATLDEMAAKSASAMPPETVRIMHRATEDLRASGIMDGVVKAGDAAPPFELRNTDNELVSLASLLGEHWLVLSFYRGVW